MKPVSPVLIGYENNILEKKIAENQPQYQTLPALPIDSDLPGTILTRWEVTDEEIEQIKESKSIYLYISTFYNPVQPVYLTSKTPDVFEVDASYAEAAVEAVAGEQLEVAQVAQSNH